MSKKIDKIRFVARDISKEIGSAALTAAGHELINQEMQSLMERLVKNMMDGAKGQIAKDSFSDSKELKDLFAKLYATKNNQKVLTQFFEEQKGQSLITSLIQNENPCLSTWDSLNSGFGDLADMHSHSGGSKNKVELFEKLAKVSKHMINGIKFISSCKHVSENTKNRLHSLVKYRTSLNEELSEVANEKEQEDEKNAFIDLAINQYNEFVRAEVLCALEYHIIRPMLKEKCMQAVKGIVSQAYEKTESIRCQIRLNQLEQGAKKMGHQELSHLLKKDSKYAKSLNEYGIVILKQEGDGHYLEHSDYQISAGGSNKDRLVGLLIKDQHAMPCIKMNGKWEPVDLDSTLNKRLAQSRFF
jgi:DNA-binding transcriptional ArsR family regulator